MIVYVKEKYVRRNILIFCVYIFECIYSRGNLKRSFNNYSLTSLQLNILLKVIFDRDKLYGYYNEVICAKWFITKLLYCCIISRYLDYFAIVYK